MTWVTHCYCKGNVNQYHAMKVCVGLTFEWVDVYVTVIGENEYYQWGNTNKSWFEHSDMFDLI